jgi:gamma-glutamyl-gamma-aminobutyrate hydrolase PuuD
LLKTIDGWFIHGGADMDASDYNEEKHLMSKPN